MDWRSGERMCRKKKRASGGDHTPKCAWKSKGVATEVISAGKWTRRCNAGVSEAGGERANSSSSSCGQPGPHS
eukprot:5521770-Prorocentrum_lima.AAC.1